MLQAQLYHWGSSYMFVFEAKTWAISSSRRDTFHLNELHLILLLLFFKVKLEFFRLVPIHWTYMMKSILKSKQGKLKKRRKWLNEFKLLWKEAKLSSPWNNYILKFKACSYFIFFELENDHLVDNSKIRKVTVAHGIYF